MNNTDNVNLWAPWRISYLRSLTEGAPDPCLADAQGAPGGCFLCDYWHKPDDDPANLVLWRTDVCIVVLNRFPYTGGHLLIAPAAHTPNFDNLDDKTLLQMMLLARDAQKLLIEAIKPQGFNLGVNINRCAGAGLPDHVHLHLVPRWQGDTNFMAINCGVRVISQALDELYKQLVDLSAKLALPSSRCSGPTD